MAAGAAPAPEKRIEAQGENADPSQTQPATLPVTLKEKIVRKLRDIFAGREEYLGWRQ